MRTKLQGGTVVGYNGQSHVYPSRTLGRRRTLRAWNNLEELAYHDGRTMCEHTFLRERQYAHNSLIKPNKFCQPTS